MKNVQFEWIQTSYQAENYLSIRAGSPVREVAQLRKQQKIENLPWSQRYRNTNSDRNWHLHPSGMTDTEIDELFGQNWYYETYGGFETVREFKRWAKDKECS